MSNSTVVVATGMSSGIGRAALSAASAVPAP